MRLEQRPTAQPTLPAMATESFGTAPASKGTKADTPAAPLGDQTAKADSPVAVAATAAAKADAPFVDSISEVAKTDAPPASNRGGFWRSLGAWAGVGLFSGLLRVGLNAALQPNVRSAFDPLIWRVNNTAQESLGARFNDAWSNPLKAAAARWIAPQKKTDATLKVFDAKLAEECVASFRRRSQVDDRVRGQTDGFFTGYLRMMQLVCGGVRDRLEAGDHHGAARRLGAAIVRDRILRYELTPSLESLHELAYVKLHPYFAKLSLEERQRFVKLVLAEAEKLVPEAERAAVTLHARPIAEGLTRTATEHAPRLAVGSGPLVEVARHANRDELAAILTGESDKAVALRKYVDDLFGKSAHGGVFGALSAKRARVRLSRAVTASLAAFEAKVGRPATLQEIWSLVTVAIETGASARIEWAATAASVGAFVAVGAAAAIPKAAMGKLDPAVAAAIDPVVFTIVGFFMGATGKFFKERLDAYGRAVSYSTPQKLSLGLAVERDLLDHFLRVLTNDGRVQPARLALMQLERFLHLNVLDAEACLREGDLRGAAAFLSGAMQYLRQTHFEFSPLTRGFELVCMKLGPHFDGLSDDQLAELRALALEDVTRSGAPSEEVARYYRPFITALTSTNVEAKIESPTKRHAAAPPPA